MPIYSDVCSLTQGLAFVGSELITFDAMTTYGLQAEWLASLLKVWLPRDCWRMFRSCACCAAAVIGPSGVCLFSHTTF